MVGAVTLITIIADDEYETFKELEYFQSDGKREAMRRSHEKTDG